MCGIAARICGVLLHSAPHQAMQHLDAYDSNRSAFSVTQPPQSQGANVLTMPLCRVMVRWNQRHRSQRLCLVLHCQSSQT